MKVNKIGGIIACGVVLVIVGVICVSNSYASNDPADEAYLVAHADDYFKKYNIRTKPEQARAQGVLVKEMERLALTTDIGDIACSDSAQRILVSIKRNASKHRSDSRFVINSFDTKRSNRCGGKVRAVFEGDEEVFAPWLIFSLDEESGRKGKKFGRIRYDVSIGEARLVHEIKNASMFPRFDGFRCMVKRPFPDTSIMFVTGQGEYVYELKGLNSGNEWDTITIPFEKLSGNDSFVPQHTREIQFVFSEEDIDLLQGEACIDSFQLVHLSGDESKAKKELVYNVDGAVRLGQNKSFFQR